MNRNRVENGTLDGLMGELQGGARAMDCVTARHVIADLLDARAELEAIKSGQGFPGLPNPFWPNGVILRYNAGGCRMGKYNAKYYRVDRLAAGITPENEADRARDLLLAILKSDIDGNGAALARNNARGFLGPKALKAAGIK